MNDHYVYVYIDPRNYSEFYYGKGKGSRKEAHLQDDGDSEKARCIRAIQDQGLQPIIRVIASGLTEQEALLVEKTLLWRLGKSLTNIASGHYSENFRPHDTLHLELAGFDFQNRIYYYNVGEGLHRNWDDYIRFGFISGGQGLRWRDAMLGFRAGDVIAAYLKGHGFVGIGVVTAKAKPAREYLAEGKALFEQDLVCKGILENSDSDALCEYISSVEWVASVNRESAKWKSNSGLYTTTHVRASLEGQPATLCFLENQFSVCLNQLLGTRIHSTNDN
jgi:hypothetical protein